MFSKNTIVIVVEDGLVESVFGVPAGYEYFIVDLDTHEFCGCEPSERQPEEIHFRQVCLNCGCEILEED